MARRGEFTERAFLNGKLDYGQAESVLDLIDAKTARAADAALEGLSGRRRRELKALYDEALDLSTQIEHALDVDEGDLPGSFLASVGSSFDALRSSLRAAVRKNAEGRLLNRGALVVLAGPPNAGKSSLMNALLEEKRAIVSDVPGTTRDSIEEWMDLAGWPIRLVDTAGLRAAGDAIEAEGVRRAEDLMAKADVVVGLGGLGGLESRLIKVHAKCDLGKGDGLNVSSKTGEGLEELKRAIVERLEAKVATCDEGEATAADTVALHEALALLEAVLPERCGIRGTMGEEDLVVLANAVRASAERLGASVGAVYSSDLLDNLFSRFCVGK